MTKETAFVFPGQGSQKVGMGYDFYRERPEVERLFDRADVLLQRWGWDKSLREICFKGPQEVLSDTRFTQPALFVASLASNTALKEEGVSPDIIGGHSVGMYAGYVAADVLSFEDGLHLISRRATLMAKAGSMREGKMAAILELDIHEVEQKLVNKNVDIANHNGPKQVVISGEARAVEQVLELFDSKQIRHLAVSIASHSQEMLPAMEGYAVAVNDVEFRQPNISIVLDTTAEIEDDIERIKRATVEQLVSRVLWVDSVNKMIQEGARTFIEVGPGTVLTGLIERINPDVRTFNVEDETSLATLLSAIH